MKRSRIPALLLALVFALAAFTACGSSGGSNGAAATMDTATMDPAAPAEASDADMYGFSEEAYSLESGADTVAGGGVSRPADVKLIYTGNLTLQATDLDEASKGIADLVASYGGYFENQEVYRNSSYQHAYFVVRVPGGQFEAFMNSISEYDGCKVTYQSTSVEDVGEQYADIENRLTTLQTKLERLQELLSKAENMEDIITIESEISDVEYEIESLSGQKNHYDSLIGYSTVYIDLNEVGVLGQGVNPGLGERLSSGFVSGIKGFAGGCADFLVWLVSNLIGVIIFLAVVVAVLTLVLRRRKKRRVAETPKPDDDSQYKQ